MADERREDQSRQQANPALNPVVPAYNHAAEMGELESLQTQLHAIVLAALDAVGNDGRISAIEAVRLAQMGFQLVSTIIGMVTRKTDTTLRDRLKFATENSRVHLPK